MRKMTEFKAEAALPKSGHVTEVCKEWLVREDGALAYKLQSQEITDYYKGNRYRNAVVRHDFPTALSEQIKEKEHADKQAEEYRKYLTEQEEVDKQIAAEIAAKLERDLEEQRQRELEQSEQIAQELQDIYVNLPPPHRRQTSSSSRPDKASINHSHSSSSSSNTSHLPENHLPLGQHSFIGSNSHDFIESDTSNRFVLPTHPHTSASSALRKSTPSQYHDVTDSIRQYDIDENTDPPLLPSHSSSSRNNFNKQSPQLSPLVDSPPARVDGKLHKLSPQKYDQMMGLNIPKDAAETPLDPNEIVNLEEFGLPLEEIKEISLKIAQEKKDEALARQLQEMEQKDGMSQEEKDRLLAIEAQDKELAKMLQEREKAKAKRAKEKARLKKMQQQQQQAGEVNGLPHGQGTSQQPHEDVEHVDLEPYSNPIDLLTHQRLHESAPMPNVDTGLLVSYTRDDDIYTLPVDSCRSGNRPTSLNISPSESQHHSMTRSGNHSFDGHDNINEISPRMSHSKSSSYDQNASPTPPYMPIQGTRRSNSSDEKKKKSKDKCTHQ